MTEATTASTKATTAKPAAPPFGLPKYEMPKMEVPAEFREMTDKGLAHARDGYAKAKVASEEAAELLQTPTRPLRRAPRTTISRSWRSPAPTLAPLLTALMNCWVRNPCRSLSSFPPRTRANSSTSFPRRIRSFGHSVRNSQPRLLSQSRQACPRHSTRPPDRGLSRNSSTHRLAARPAVL
jgi:hypothetical protein